MRCRPAEQKLLRRNVARHRAKPSRPALCAAARRGTPARPSVHRPCLRIAPWKSRDEWHPCELARCPRESCPHSTAHARTVAHPHAHVGSRHFLCRIVCVLSAPLPPRIPDSEAPTGVALPARPQTMYFAIFDAATFPRPHGRDSGGSRTTTPLPARCRLT